MFNQTVTPQLHNRARPTGLKDLTGGFDQLLSYRWAEMISLAGFVVY